ncbi:hypothetical protein RV15_GL000677 [Enterococcus silesiacus]|nr:hypothetical protein RV15_GL000677 [Enterococcus silesiacus]
MDFGDIYVSGPTIFKGDSIIDENTEIDYHQNVSLAYTYNIPNNISITAGDTMDLRIPENTLIASSFSYDIVADDGTLIMTISGDALSNTATATFGPYYELHKANRQGEILFYARGSTMMENEEWVMNKVGWNSFDNTSAVWNIIINPDSKYITNVILTDILGEMQELNSGFLIQAELGTYDKKTQYFQALEPIDPSKISSTDVGFVIDLGTLNNAVSLTYVSNKLSDKNLPYRNKAILQADGDGDPVVIEAETPGIGGGGSGSGDPGESTSETIDTSSGESSTTEKDSEETTSETIDTSSTESSSEEIATTSDTTTESIEESIASSTNESNTSSQESISSSDSVIVAELEEKSSNKLPKTGYLKSMIALTGYGLIFISIALFLIKKKNQDNNKR